MGASFHTAGTGQGWEVNCIVSDCGSQMVVTI